MIHHILKGLFQHGAKHATKKVVQQTMITHAPKAAVIVATPWMKGAQAQKHTLGFLGKASRWGMSLFKRT
jgi:hypothetical protein